MDEKQAIHEAFTSLAPRYEKVVNKELQRFWGWSYSDFADHVIRMTPLQQGDAILDVATGTAVIPLKLVMGGQTGGKIIGLDITLAMLAKARQKLEAVKLKPSASVEHVNPVPIRLSCASAMAMPYRNKHFNVIFCALATHHLDVPLVLSEMFRVLQPGGRVTIADVMGSVAWRQPVIRVLLRAATFLYFLPQEGFARARAESFALFNVYSEDEWVQHLNQAGFGSIKITQLPTRRSWLPSPLVIQAQKMKMEGISGDSW